MTRFLYLALASVFAMTFFAGNPARAAGDKLVIELKTGKVVIQLRPDLAPKHVERVKTLAGQGFYNGLKWHRVIDGFMAQTGDPTGTGMSGSKLPDLPAELLSGVVSNFNFAWIKREDNSPIRLTGGFINVEPGGIACTKK